MTAGAAFDDFKLIAGADYPPATSTSLIGAGVAKSNSTSYPSALLANVLVFASKNTAFA